MLWMMCLLKVITSYDSGAYGAVLGIDDGIASDLRLSVVDEGALGSAPFIGNTIGCALASMFFARYEAKTVLIMGMTLHMLGSLLFALSTEFLVAMVARVIIGFTLAFVVVYSVVWTDIFSPPERATTWMAAMNAGVPLGMLIGFVMGGSIIPELELSWRFTFVFKAVVLVPVLFGMNRLQPAVINEPVQRKRAAFRGSAGEFCQAVANNSLHLLRNELFVSATGGLCVLYFCVTAMQVFITPYLRGAPYYASMNTIVFGFGATSVTAPIFGVVVGGMTLDRMGGYQNNLPRAATFGAVCGALAAWFGFVACFTTTVPTFIGALWLMLFCGAANVPVGTGILMASVHPTMRATASSYAAIAFNVLGYFLGPIVCGTLADRTGSLRTAFHLVLMSSGLGIIPLALTARFAAQQRQRQKEAAAEAKDPDAAELPTESPTVVVPVSPADTEAARA